MQGPTQTWEVCTQRNMGSPFSPPADFSGGSDDYLRYMRTVLENRGARQRIEIICRHPMSHMIFTGPYAEEAKQLVNEYRRPKR